MTLTYKIGTGTLTWDRQERITDRYGFVMLMADGLNSQSTGSEVPSLIRNEPPIPAGRIGRLVAKVKIARKSTHIGDLFRGIFPRTPKVGDEIVLGEGVLTVEKRVSGIHVGLMPEDGRSADWLDPRALYDAHEQTVELVFEQP